MSSSRSGPMDFQFSPVGRDSLAAALCCVPSSRVRAQTSVSQLALALRGPEQSALPLSSFRGRIEFSSSFLVSLRFVMIENPLNSRLTPAGWKFLINFLLSHRFFLRLRRIARFAFGPSSYAVMTKIESGIGSGT